MISDTVIQVASAEALECAQVMCIFIVLERMPTSVKTTASTISSGTCADHLIPNPDISKDIRLGVFHCAG